MYQITQKALFKAKDIYICIIQGNLESVDNQYIGLYSKYR